MEEGAMKRGKEKSLTVFVVRFLSIKDLPLFR